MTIAYVIIIYGLKKMFELLLSMNSGKTRALVGVIGEAVANPSFSLERVNFAMCVQNKTIYIAGGKDSQDTPMRTMSKYDTITGTWTALAPIPTQVSVVYGGSMVAIGNSIYLFTNNAANTGSYGIYNITNNTWTFRTTGGYGTNGNAGIVASGNDIFHVGGTGTGRNGYFLKLDTLTWNYIRLSDVPGTTSNCSAIMKDGFIYCNTILTDGKTAIYRYDTNSTGTWIDTGIRLPGDPLAVKLVNCNGFIVSGLGYKGTTGIKEINVSNTVNAKSSLNVTLPESRAMGSMVSIDDTVWVFGGYVNNAVTGAAFAKLTPIKQTLV